VTPVRDDRYRKSYDAHDLLDGERLVDGWTTSGGYLWLTSQRLLHEPMRTPEDFLASAARLFGFGDAGDALKTGVSLLDRRTKWAMPIGDVASVSPGPGATTLSFTRRSGEIWSVDIAAGLYAFRGGAASQAARDRAVSAIRTALGAQPSPEPRAGSGSDFDAVISRLGRAPAPDTIGPAIEDDSLPPPLRRAREQARTSGRNVEIPSEDGTVAYFSPDGFVHLGMFGYGGPEPAGAARPDNLVGRWVVTQGWESDWPGQPAFLELSANGALSGRVAMFGALPPLPLLDASWWWTQADHRLTLEFRLPPVEDTVIEGRFPLRVTVVEPNRMAGVDDGWTFELVRAP
jgi:hypothetical protein